MLERRATARRAWPRRRATPAAAATSGRSASARTAQHLDSSKWHKRIECATCHTVPQEIGDPGHIDTELPAEVKLAGIGDGGTWDRAAQTCTNTYCHGATLTNTSDDRDRRLGGRHRDRADLDARRRLAEPVRLVPRRPAAGAAPAGRRLRPVPPDDEPGRGHGDRVSRAPHRRQARRRQHRGRATAATARPVSPRRRGTRSATPRPTLRGVGAHAAHLTANSPWHAPINCIECHKCPAGVNDQGHIDTRAAGGDRVGPARRHAARGTAPTCSNTYCHGGGTEPAQGRRGDLADVDQGRRHAEPVRLVPRRAAAGAAPGR